jgi:hypothetical protein
MRILLTLLLVLGLASCRTIEIRRPVKNTGTVRVGLPGNAWEVYAEDGELAGLVVLFEEPGSAQGLYMVRNIWHQDLGLIDVLGRAYRYLPHHKEPAWIGSGSVTQGIARILGVESCELVEVPFRAEEAGAAPGQMEQRRADRS